MYMLGFFVVLGLGVGTFLQGGKWIFRELETALHSFPSKNCESDINTYWFSEYPKHCIPPPWDHSAFFVPRGSAPPAICVFVRHAASLQGIKIKTKTGEHSCSYL